jgi:hypothetical protein
MTVVSLPCSVERLKKLVETLRQHPENVVAQALPSVCADVIASAPQVQNIDLDAVDNIIEALYNADSIGRGIGVVGKHAGILWAAVASVCAETAERFLTERLGPPDGPTWWSFPAYVITLGTSVAEQGLFLAVDYIDCDLGDVLNTVDVWTIPIPKHFDELREWSERVAQEALSFVVR